MIEAAELAAALNSAPGFVALKGLLTEAARLKRLTAETLPVCPAPAPRPAARPFRVLTDEEWQAKFAHLAHRAP
jgi:hypothetical protein